jgi:hypothetical protein
MPHPSCVLPGRSRARGQQLFDPIQDFRGDARLRLQRQRLRACGADNRHRIRVDVEAGIGPRASLA